LTSLKYTVVNLLKLNKWIRIGITMANKANKNAGYRNFIDKNAPQRVIRG